MTTLGHLAARTLEDHGSSAADLIQQKKIPPETEKYFPKHPQVIIEIHDREQTTLTVEYNGRYHITNYNVSIQNLEATAKFIYMKCYENMQNDLDHRVELAGSETLYSILYRTRNNVKGITIEQLMELLTIQANMWI